MATTSSSSIGSSIVSSLGIGMYDPKTIAEALANAETIGRKSTLETKQEAQKNKLTAYTTVQNALQGLKSGLSGLVSASIFSQKALTTSDSSIVGATMTSSAGAGTYEIDVTQKASSHTIATQGFTSKDVAIGAGTLTLSVGGSSHDIEINDSNGSLSAIKESINNLNMGVSASIVNDGSGYRLLLASQNSGATNAVSLQVTADDDGDLGDDAGLSKLASGIKEVSAAKDAIFSVNGLDLVSSSNKISGVIEGVTLNINKAGSSSVVIASDTSTVKESIKTIVDDYNAMKSILDNYTSYEKSDEDPTKGILSGDSTVSQLRYQMRSLLNFRSNDRDALVQSMADVGVKTELDGSLSLDETVLDQMMIASPTDVSKLFSTIATPDEKGLPFIRFTGATARTVDGAYEVNIARPATQATYNGGVASDPHLANGTFKINVNGVDSNTLAVSPLTTQLTSDVFYVASETDPLSDFMGAFGDTSGKLRVALGASSLDITLDDTSSLSSIAQSINDASNLGISAAVTGDSVDGFSLVLNRTNGLIPSNGISFSVVEDAYDNDITDTDYAGWSTLFSNKIESATNDHVASYLQYVINNDSNLKAKDARVSVSYDAGSAGFQILTEKYGSASSISLSDVDLDLSTALGWVSSPVDANGVVTLSRGFDVSGSLVDDTEPVLNPQTGKPTGQLGVAFTFVGTGQHVKINSLLTGSPKDLEFDVLGDGADGSILTVTKGYASGLSSKIDAMLNSSNGLIGSKVTNITKSNTTIDGQLTKVQEKYDALVQKYVYQFGMVNALQEQMSALSTSLKAMFQQSSSDE